ncbi:TPA: hypothetical protein ACGQ50_000811 [Enterobacter cloacae]
MKTLFKNYATRTEALRSLKVGDSILLMPYKEGDYAREQASLASTAVRIGIMVEQRQALICIEGEVTQNFIRVKRVS